MLGEVTEFEGHDANQVLQRLDEDLEAKIWKEASSARNGDGLDKGKPDFSPASNMHAKFVKAGKFKEAKALEVVVCNKVWSKQRLLEAGMINESEALCDRCHEEIETDFHRCYGCKANDSIDSEDVSKTEWLVKEAKGSPQHKCLWFRAILPGRMTSKPVGWAPEEDDDDHVDEHFAHWLDEVGKAGTDGTGGADVNPRTPRAYAGDAVLNPEGTKVAYMYCKVRGRQTVPRAELT